MERGESLVRYEQCLCSFCRQSAFLEQIKYRLEKGEVVSEQEMTSHLSLLANSRKALLELKEQLGFHDGLEFTDDCRFYGFQYKDGMLSGDFEKLPDVILPWIETFDEEKRYTYEVGVLLLFHYMWRKERAKLEAKQKKRLVRKERFRRLWRRIICIERRLLLFWLSVKEEELIDE